MIKEFFDMSFSTLRLVRGRCAAAFCSLLPPPCSLLCSRAQPTKIPRIAYLGATSLTANAARVEAFRQGLRELGYVEGKNIVIELRSADGEQDRLPALCALLLALSFPAKAQQPTKVARIGFLTSGSPRIAHLLEGFKQGLREHGYVEDRTSLRIRYVES